MDPITARYHAADKALNAAHRATRAEPGKDAPLEARQAFDAAESEYNSARAAATEQARARRRTNATD